MLSHFRLLPFLAGLLLASLIFLVYKPQQQIIKKYPHPNDNDGKVYNDPNRPCYKYSVHEVNCDANEATLKDYPVQG
jgi:hypothetical protein